MFNIYATDYAPVDPITPPCDIVPIFIGYKGENKARCLVFDLTECVSTFGDGGFVISFIRQGDELPYLVTNTDRLDNNAIWIINSTDTAVDGYGMVQLQYIVDDVICKSALYRTVTFDSNGITGDVPDPYEDLLAQIAAYAATAEGAATTATAAANTATTAVENGIVTERSQRIAADNGLQQQITNLMGLAGAPVMANTAAAMTDSSKIYVYTGSEAGYVFGNWYYYNGAEWVSGGVYQASAVETDPTLSVEGMAADAAATGDLKRQIMSAFVEESASGSIASFTDGADDVPLKSLVVNITPKQASGTPSPTNILPITGWTEANIFRCGKNLFDVSTSTPKTFVNTQGRIVISDNWSTSDYIPIVAGVTYTLSGVENAGWAASHSFYDINKAFISYVYATNHNTFEAPANAAFVKLSLRTETPTDVQLEIGSAATTFEPYNGGTYNVSFGSAGTVYGGTLDVTNGMLTVTRALRVLNGSETWSVNSATTNLYYAGNDTFSGIKVAGFITSSMFTATSVAGAQMAIGQMKIAGTNINFKTNSATLNDWKAALQQNNVQVLYELANPISVQLTATEVRTLLANNNIWSDTGSVASCEYRADTKLYLEKLTNPDNDMTADANIASGQYFMVNNTLYLATAAIASGATIVPGTNCTETSLAAALNAINA